jgi:hypothetical protein
MLWRILNEEDIELFLTEDFSKEYLSKKFKIPLKNVINVTVNLYPLLESVTNSCIKLIKTPTGAIDPSALQSYNDFILSVWEIFEHYKCDVKGHYPSSLSVTSWYAYFYPRNSKGQLKDGHLIIMRISDHPIPKSTFDKKNKRAAQKFIEIDSQRWEAKNVLVNNETFNSYESATQKIESIIKSLSR